MCETASKRVYKSKRCVLFTYMTFRPSQRTLFMARRNWVLLALISFVVQYVCFLVLYQTFPCIRSSGSRYDMLKTDCDFKMSEISNIACRWVKTMPEVLKPRPLHVHGNFVFSVCKLLKTKEWPRSRTDGFHPTWRSSIFYPKHVW